MSTISRRDFMKTAGVMTLAVAASAALAGCSTNGAEDPASSASQAIVEKTNNEINKTATYSNGQIAKFGKYNHKIKVDSTIYEYMVPGRSDVYCAVAVTTCTLAAGDETTGAHDLGATYTGGADHKATITLKNGKQDLTKTDLDYKANLHVYFDAEGAKDEQDQVDYRQLVWDEVGRVNDSSKESLADKYDSTYSNDMSKLVGESHILLGGESMTTIVPLVRGYDTKVTGQFDNDLYMEDGSEVKFDITAKTVRVTLARL